MRSQNRRTCLDAKGVAPDHQLIASARSLIQYKELAGRMAQLGTR